MQVETLSSLFSLSNRVKLIQSENFEPGIGGSPIEIMGFDYVLCIGGDLDSDPVHVPNKPHYLLLAGIMGLNLPASSYRVTFGLSLQDYYQRKFHLSHLQKLKTIRAYRFGQYLEKKVEIKTLNYIPSIYAQAKFINQQYGKDQFLLISFKEEFIEGLFFDQNKPLESQLFVSGMGFQSWLKSTQEEEGFQGLMAKAETAVLLESLHENYVNFYLSKKIKTFLRGKSISRAYIQFDQALGYAEDLKEFLYMKRISEFFDQVSIIHFDQTRTLKSLFQIQFPYDKVSNMHQDLGVLISNREWVFMGK